MEITTRTVNEITVVAISGSLDTQTSGDASDKLSRIAQGSSKMLLNLENLDYLSTAGLRVFLRAAKQIKGSGGSLKVSNATGIVKEVMDIAGFGNFIDIYNLETDALSDF
jgi:anti-sigma B factor antagonist